MDRTEELEQRVWEFVYELLPEEEADEVRRWITSDPDVARLYAELKLQADLLAEASKMSGPPIPYEQLAEQAEATPRRPDASESDRRRQRSPAARVANWAVGLAATLAIGILGFAYVKSDSPIRQVAVQSHERALIDRYVGTTLLGPESLQAEPANFFVVRTHAADGRPLPVELACRFYDADGDLLADRELRTDVAGWAPIEMDERFNAAAARLELEPKTPGAGPLVDRRLSVADVELATHVSTDKPRYGPGQSVRYRSVTLSRFGRRACEDVAVEFQLLDPNGHQMPQFRSSGRTDRGVMQGQFVLPAGQPAGTYALVARSPSGRFPEAHCSFDVVGGRMLAGKTMAKPSRQTAGLHRGAGSFRPTPQADRQSRAEIDSPSAAKRSANLPPTSDRYFLTIDAGRGVFDAGQDMALRIRSSDCTKPVAITASCRGVVVGQALATADRFLTREAGVGVCDLTMTLADGADGSIRVTAYDLSARPPDAVAQRWVYRRPERRLRVRIAEPGEPYRPGESVDLSLAVEDERGQPQQAVLGVSVVDDRLPRAAAGGDPTNLMARFSRADRIDVTKDLDSVDAYPQDDAEAATGWLEEADAQPTAGPGLQPAREAPDLVVLADTQRQAWSAMRHAVRAYHAARQVDLRRIGQIGFAAGAAVLIALAIMGLLRLAGDARVWAPAAAAGMICLLVGWQWMGTMIDIGSRLAQLPHPPNMQTPGRPVQVAQAERRGPQGQAAPGMPEALKSGGDDLGDRMVAADEEGRPLAMERDATAETMGERPAPARGAVSSGPKGRVAAEDSDEALEEKLPAAAPLRALAEKEAATADSAPPASRPRPEPADRKRALASQSGGFGFGGGAAGRSSYREAAKAEPEEMRALEAKPTEGGARARRAKQLAANAPMPRKPAAAAESMAVGAAGPAAVSRRPDTSAPAPSVALDRMGAVGDVSEEAKSSRDRPFYSAEKKRELDKEQLRLGQYSDLFREQGESWIGAGSALNLYWQPLLLTDRSGKASVRFVLPDGVQRFRVQVDAHANGRIGSALRTFTVGNAPSRQP